MVHPRFLVLDLVAATPRLLRGGSMPRVEAYARERELRALRPSLPALTCTGHADLLCGAPPRVHGAVGNGWYFRELAEVWLWRQSASLLQAPTIFERWRAAHPGSPTAQIFWWWNLPSRADLSVTPRPTYWADGRKGPDIHAHPTALRARLNARLGDFPLFRFWGPAAGIESTRWIVDATLDVLREERPGLTLAYLPHLDYALQRHGPDGPEAQAAAAELDHEAARLLDHAAEEGIAVILVSGYGIHPVTQACFPNRALREADLLAIHPARNGALLDPGNSRAFALCDHQCAHVYVREPGDLARVRTALAALPGVERVLDRAALAAHALDHPRSGELFLIARPGWWFAYPYWSDADREPDFARCVDIHRKPGYDPCELFLDPELGFPRVRVAAKLLAAKLGFRTTMDLIPLDTSLVRGSHGRPEDDPDRGPLWIGPPELLPDEAAAPGAAVPAPAALAKLLPLTPPASASSGS